MASRVDMDKLNDVLLQNEALAEERQTLQHRLQAQSVEHAQQTGQLKAELASLRADLIRLQAERDQACAQWAALQATAADRIAHLEVAQAHADLLDDNRRLRRLLERRQPEPEQAPPPMPRSTALQPAAPPCATWCATGCDVYTRQVHPRRSRAVPAQPLSASTTTPWHGRVPDPAYSGLRSVGA